MWRSNPAALLDILEATYRLEESEKDWMAGILKAVAARIGGDGGVGATLYDASNEAQLKLRRLCTLGVSDEWTEAGIAMHSSPEVSRIVASGYRKNICGNCDEFTAPINAEVRRAMQRHGLRDQAAMNGIDSSHHGIAVYTFSRRDISLSLTQRDQMQRIATHLATAYRLRRRLDAATTQGATEAILYPDGRIEHAEGVARKKEARLALADAVQEREWARRWAQRDSTQALSGWRTMVQARWTLLDYCAADTPRYVIARENVALPGRFSTLSPREGQVASLAALGRSNKLIAYELGLSDSTVRVLMARAAAKIGVRSRTALVEHYHQQQSGIERAAPDSDPIR